MSTDPAREEAWNCNRCRDSGVLVWNGHTYRCERGCPVVPGAQPGPDVVVSGSLPLQGTEATIGGAGAGPNQGPSCDAALRQEPGTELVHPDDPDTVWTVVGLINDDVYPVAVDGWPPREGQTTARSVRVTLDWLEACTLAGAGPDSGPSHVGGGKR